MNILRALLLFGFSSLVLAQETSSSSTWEFGLGAGAIHAPDYRGSKESRTYGAPIPYVVYRGKFIQSDRDGVRGQFLQGDKLEFNLSMSANVTPESHKNPLRRELQLPELGSSLELGPALNINLTGDSLREGWMLSLPLRAVFSIGGDDRGYTGYVFQPQLVYLHQRNGWGMSFRSSLSYASKEFHRYYYQLPEELATEKYAAYNPDAGYSGWANQIAITRRIDNWRLAFFVRHDYLDGTEFEDSPLMETNHSIRSGVAIIRSFR